MTGRRLLTLAVLVVLAAGAGVAAWRSSQQPAPAAESVAAGLRCPSCEGESVAASGSPVAAAMREVVAAQLAQGRSEQQIREWFLQRYGPEVLDTPPRRGVGLLLWAVPGAVLLGAMVLAVRAVRSRPTAGDEPAAGYERAVGDEPAAADQRAAGGAGPRRAHHGRVWDLAAVGLVGMVVVVALVSPRLTGAGSGGDSGAGPAGATAGRAAADPVSAELALGRELERQGDFAAAAEVYRSALAQRPDDGVRLRLAFALLRSDRAAEAVPLAEQVVDARPDDPEAVLILGLAQRAAGESAATDTLRRFLELAPDHPGAAEVRRLLDEP